MYMNVCLNVQIGVIDFRQVVEGEGWILKNKGGQVGRATCDVTAVRTGAVRQPNGQTGATEVKRETKKKDSTIFVHKYTSTKYNTMFR